MGFRSSGFRRLRAFRVLRVGNVEVFATERSRILIIARGGPGVHKVRYPTWHLPDVAKNEAVQSKLVLKP